MSPELLDQIERMHAEDGPNYSKKGEYNVTIQRLTTKSPGEKGDLTISSQEEMASVLDMAQTGEVNVDKESLFLKSTF